MIKIVKNNDGTFTIYGNDRTEQLPTNAPHGTTAVISDNTDKQTYTKIYDAEHKEWREM